VLFDAARLKTREIRYSGKPRESKREQHINFKLSSWIVIFGPRRDEVTGESRRLHKEELNDLYCSPNIMPMIKWRRMRLAGHVARMGEERGV
jgi:hypothetical protein